MQQILPCKVDAVAVFFRIILHGDDLKQFRPRDLLQDHCRHLRIADPQRPDLSVNKILSAPGIINN